MHLRYEEKEKTCRYCGKTFANTDGLLDHIGKKHVWLPWGRHKERGGDGDPTTTLNPSKSYAICSILDNHSAGATGYSCVRKYVSRRLKVFIKTHLEP